MPAAKGMALISALLFLLMLSLIVASNLYISQLSIKSAYAGQQQLIQQQQAYLEHVVSLPTMDTAHQVSPVTQRQIQCPAHYAAWSSETTFCYLLLVESMTTSADNLFENGYSTLLLKKKIVAGGSDE